MGKIRINELARELEVKAHEILEKLPELGVADKKTHSSSLDDDVVYKLRRYYGHEDVEPPSGGEIETAPQDRAPAHAEPAPVSNGQPKFQPVVDAEPAPAAPAAHTAPTARRQEIPREEPPAAEPGKAGCSGDAHSAAHRHGPAHSSPHRVSFGGPLARRCRRRCRYRCMLQAASASPGAPSPGTPSPSTPSASTPPAAVIAPGRPTAPPARPIPSAPSPSAPRPGQVLSGPRAPLPPSEATRPSTPSMPRPPRAASAGWRSAIERPAPLGGPTHRTAGGAAASRSSRQTRRASSDHARGAFFAAPRGSQSCQFARTRPADLSRPYPPRPAVGYAPGPWRSRWSRSGSSRYPARWPAPAASHLAWTYGARTRAASG